MLVHALRIALVLLVAAPLAAAVKQPDSVTPIQASKAKLFPNDDILGLTFNYEEQRWRIARATIVQQGQEIATDELEQLTPEPAPADSTLGESTTSSPAITQGAEQPGAPLIFDQGVGQEIRFGCGDGQPSCTR